MENLNILRNSNWYTGHFPNMDELERVEKTFYSASSHALILGNSFSRRSNKFKDEHPDWVSPAPDHIMKPLWDRAKKEVDSQEKAKELKKFRGAITGNHKSVEEQAVLRYLEGERPLEGAELRLGAYQIKGQTLSIWGWPLLRKVGPDEYLLGHDMSNHRGGLSDSRLYIAITVITSYPATFWPSELARLDQDLPSSALVLNWCLRQLLICQLMYPTAKKHKTGYEVQYKRAIKVYRKAVRRWSVVESETAEAIEELIKLFGNVKEMRVKNNALRMQYTLERG